MQKKIICIFALLAFLAGWILAGGYSDFDKLRLHDGYSKAFNMPIVAYSLVKYFTENIPIEETIYNHRDIYDFCKSVNVGSQFDLISINVKNNNIKEEKIQKHTRFYVAKKGSYLVKRYRDKDKQISLTAGKHVQIFNDYFEVDDFKDYNIDYVYYLKEANKLKERIEKNIEKQQLSLF